eukprot:1142696-Pelagomonas_calceolata.AAC.3
MREEHVNGRCDCPGLLNASGCTSELTAWTVTAPSQARGTQLACRERRQHERWLPTLCRCSSALTALWQRTSIPA